MDILWEKDTLWAEILTEYVIKVNNALLHLIDLDLPPLLPKAMQHNFPYKHTVQIQLWELYEWHVDLLDFCSKAEIFQTKYGWDSTWLVASVQILEFQKKMHCANVDYCQWHFDNSLRPFEYHMTIQRRDWNWTNQFAFQLDKLEPIGLKIEINLDHEKRISLVKFLVFLHPAENNCPGKNNYIRNCRTKMLARSQGHIIILVHFRSKW
jgi:hypothetical protein